MPVGAPGANSRGRGGKFKKYTRGGGKHYSRDLRPLDADGNEISMWSVDAKKLRESGEGDDEDGDEDEDEDEDEMGDDDARRPVLPPSGLEAEADSREARKEAKKARKAAAIARNKAKSVQVGDMPSDSEEDSSSDAVDEELPANPNHSHTARKQALPGEDEDQPAVSSPPRPVPVSLKQLSLSERRDDDLARLQEVKRKREEVAKLRAAELELKKAEEEAKKAEREAKEAKKREFALGKKSKKAVGQKSGTS